MAGRLSDAVVLSFDFGGLVKAIFLLLTVASELRSSRLCLLTSLPVVFASGGHEKSKS